MNAIELLLRLCREFDCRIHVVHLSAARAIGMLREARNRGLPVTVETCPHYLHLAAEEIEDGATQYKCAPPIRGRQNREALWQGLRDGVIDLIATDHSPCPPAMKHLDRGDFRTAWGGISSVSLALPVVWTEARQRGFSLTDIARWMAERPAELAGLQETKGRLAAGLDADFAVFDPETEMKRQRGAASLPSPGDALPWRDSERQSVWRRIFAENVCSATAVFGPLPAAAN